MSVVAIILVSTIFTGWKFLQTEPIGAPNAGPRPTNGPIEFNTTNTANLQYVGNWATVYDELGTRLRPSGGDLHLVLLDGKLSGASYELSVTPQGEVIEGEGYLLVLPERHFEYQFELPGMLQADLQCADGYSRVEYPWISIESWVANGTTCWGNPIVTPGGCQSNKCKDNDEGQPGCTVTVTTASGPHEHEGACGDAGFEYKRCVGSWLQICVHD